MENELYHIGVKRKSGRYPWGSGENPYQHESWFLSYVNDLHQQGMSDVEIARSLGISTTTLRERRSIAKDELRAAQAAQAIRLKDKGYSNTKIGEMLGGLPESTVRNLLNPALQTRVNVTKNTAELLKDAIANKQFIDVGSGVESYLGISKTKLNTAVQLLEDDGYIVYPLKVEQLGTGHKTELKVLCPPGTEYMDLVQNREKISLPIGSQYLSDNGTTLLNIKPPVSINPKRVAVRYAEEGGTDMDGVILLRRGVEDLSLGDSQYAQVRIKVGDSHYLKGMAMYSDSLPDGVDLMFNTNKPKGTPMLGEKDNTVLKNLKDDPDNPFGATVRQYEYPDSKGKLHQSPINIVNEEGDWGEWSKTLSSQMLSKQPVSVAKKQLDKAYDAKFTEYQEITALTNPAVKKKLLESFADECDAAAVHLKAAALPRQATHVILPFPGMKEDEIYAPNYENGETVVLVRFPHGGTFEIPTLKVNNRSLTAKKAIGNAVDAVGINPRVAERLSGADFDGDTVLVIPNKDGAIKTSAALAALKNFSPTEYYPAYEGMPRVGPDTGFHKQTEMGKVSNLITDMTIKAATQDEIARAVKHSMVVIDAEKHNLNWRQSYIDNGIAQLKEKYQGGAQRGASTLISKAKSEERVPQRKQRTGIDPETGAKIYYETGATRKDPKTGKEIPLTTKSTKMAETSDAFTLSSGTRIEETYASYANSMKALANQARKELISTPSQKYSPSAKTTYAKEVKDLQSKLEVALKNAPLERQAQLHANIVVAAKLKDNPGLDHEQKQRLKAQALASSRVRVGAKKTRVEITPKEWEAIQAGAISNNQLIKILNNTDMDVIKSYATPRSTNTGLTSAQISRARALINSGKTQAEVAAALGISTSTLRNVLNK